MGVSYKAKEKCKNLNNFFITEEVVLIPIDRKTELENKKEILTPEEMAEYERIIKTSDV